MSLGKKIDIEPLGDGRWTRVERAVFSALPDHEAGTQTPAVEAVAPRWRPALLVLAGAFAAVVGAVTWRALVQPDAPSGPTRIETAAYGSKVEVGESTVEVGPQSVVRLTGDDAHGVNVLLDEGRVECDVAPRRGRPPFLVEAGVVEVRVIGTHFAVTRTGDAVSVDVQRGRVEVVSREEHVFLAAGSHWPVVPSAAPPSVSPPGSSPSEGAEQPSPTAAAAGPVSPASEGLARAASSEPRSGAAAPPPHLSPREQYQAASRLEARQPDAAVAAYDELAKQGGAWGMNALFAEGWLEADRGHRDEAHRLLQDYLTRYPFGPNAEDARRLLERLR